MLTKYSIQRNETGHAHGTLPIRRRPRNSSVNRFRFAVRWDNARISAAIWELGTDPATLISVMKIDKFPTQIKCRAKETSLLR